MYLTHIQHMISISILHLTSFHPLIFYIFSLFLHSSILFIPSSSFQYENTLHFISARCSLRNSSIRHSITEVRFPSYRIPSNHLQYFSYIIPRDSDMEYFVPAPVMKKSLRRLAGSNSRNCFFSPINCVITHDASTYRKLAGIWFHPYSSLAFPITHPCLSLRSNRANEVLFCLSHHTWDKHTNRTTKQELTNKTRHAESLEGNEDKAEWDLRRIEDHSIVY